MKYLKFALILIASLASLSWGAAPVLLVAQEFAPMVDDYDPNVNILNEFVKELDGRGKFDIIKYDVNNQEVIDAFTKWNNTTPIEKPDIKTLTQIIKSMKIDYLVVIQGARSGDALEAGARLYRPDKAKYTWRFYNSFSVSTNKTLDWQGTINSAARTIAFVTASEPFAFVKITKKTSDEQTTLPPVNSQENERITKSNYTELGDTALANGNYNEAILQYREAIDKEPLNPICRSGLIKAYIGARLFSAAIKECARVIQLIPSSPEFATAYAEALLANGDNTQAEKTLNEIIAAQPDYPDAYLALGDVYLSRGNNLKAETLYRIAAEKSPQDVEPLLRIVRAQVLEGGFAQAIKTIEQIKQIEPKAAPSVVLERWNVWLSILNVSLTKTEGDITDIKRQGKSLNPDYENLKLISATMLKRITGMKEFIASLDYPEANKVSRDSYILTIQLFSQSAYKISQFVETRSEDKLMDSTLLQIEALDEWKTAETLYKNELKKQ